MYIYCPHWPNCEMDGDVLWSGDRILISSIYYGAMLHWSERDKNHIRFIQSCSTLSISVIPILRFFDEGLSIKSNPRLTIPFRKRKGKVKPGEIWCQNITKNCKEFSTISSTQIPWYLNLEHNDNNNNNNDDSTGIIDQYFVEVG